MNDLTIAVFAPLIMALLCFVFKRAAKWLALLVSLGIFTLAIKIFLAGQLVSQFLSLRAYPFSAGIFLAAAFFTLLITLYSFKYMEGKERLGEYYAYILITLGSAAGALFAADFLNLLFFWGMMGIPLYMLIGIGSSAGAGAAKKTLILVGGADAMMIMGIGIVWVMTRSLQIGPSPLPLNNVYSIVAFLALAAGAFAKAGVMPFHSWIPDSAEFAPASVMALLPASLDKLLGIYLFSRICFDVFQIVPNSPVSLFLLACGSITIIAAVMGALVQHDLKKLLSFHAVSQVGYMVLGIGTGTPLGVAGGIFHMFNHAIYKSCLFLCGGAVEQKAGTTDLEKLGGLAKFMPITFTAFLIAALSISGVPPFNGFISKWMIYQAIVQLGKISPYWIIWLVAAMFGSAFTLASFVKLTHAVFLGQWSETTGKTREVSWMMWLPLAVLAALCVVFGLLAAQIPLKYLVFPNIQFYRFTGVWEPGMATLLLLSGLLLGLLIYALGRVKKVTVKPAFTGGELLKEEEIKVTGNEFYDSIKSWGPLNLIYKTAEKKYFDVYELGRQAAFAVAGWLSWLHNGLLQTYLVWLLMGLVVLLLFLAR
ncbi:MAG: complex I subunit 5 family protein [Candidatus Margulisbacteria bacterium]|nr:complex I subunit 5 family protein [Candidatus Margulisiibacteriota bacterium]